MVGANVYGMLKTALEDPAVSEISLAHRVQVLREELTMMLVRGEISQEDYKDLFILLEELRTTYEAHPVPPTYNPPPSMSG